MGKYLLLLLCVWSCFSASGQNSFKLSGIIIDSITSQPVPLASVYSENLKHGVLCDSNGKFSLDLSKGSNTLIITSIGYERKIITFYISRPVDIIFNLQMSPRELKEVTVLASRASPVLNQKAWEVKDYDFLGENILLMTAHASSSDQYLILIGQKNDTLARLPLPKEEFSFFRDCEGNIFLLSEKKVNQVVFENGKLDMLPPLRMEVFDEVIRPCVEKSRTRYFLAQYHYHNLVTNYYSSPHNSIEWQPLCSIYDKKKIDLYKSEMKNIAKLQATHTEAFIDMQYIYAQKVMCRPVYSPLFVINDTPMVFNHFISRIETYTPSGEFIRSIPVQYNQDKNWAEKLIKDDSSGHVFALFRNASRNILYPINLSRGTLGAGFLLDYSFCEKIQIRKGEIFFLCKDREERNTGLFRLRAGL